MKTITLSSILIFSFKLSFSQIVFGGVQGIKDTSDYPQIRGKLKNQELFIKLDSNDVAAYFKRASFEYQLGNYEKAISQLNNMLKRFPGNAADIYSNRGMNYTYLAKFDLALADLNKAKELDPGDAMSYLNLAFVKTSMQNYKDAVTDLDTAIMLRPEYAKAFANRGMAKMKLGNYSAAIEDYNSAIKIKADYFEVYYNRGYSNFMLNKFNESLADYNKSLLYYPGMAQSYEFFINRALVYEKLGDAVNAKADKDRADDVLRSDFIH